MRRIDNCRMPEQCAHSGCTCIFGAAARPGAARRGFGSTCATARWERSDRPAWPGTPGATKASADMAPAIISSMERATIVMFPTVGAHLCLFERSCPSKHLCCQHPRLGALDDCWRVFPLGVHSSVAIAHRPGSRAARRCVGVCRSKGVFSAGRQAGAALALRAWQCKTL